MTNLRLLDAVDAPSSPQPPTREQIVRVLIGYYGQDIDIVTGQSVEQDAATDLLALIQNGADRG